MKLTLITDTIGDNYTFSKLYIDSELICDVLEDKTRDTNGDGKLDSPKVYGQTAIPYGTFEVTLIDSPHFKRKVPLLAGVPGFSAVEIHPGNTIEDTKGCLLPGVRDEKSHTIKGGTSTAAFNKIMVKLLASGQQIWTLEKIMSESLKAKQ